VLERIRLGKAEIVVGTHALFSRDVGFRNLGLTVIDEQHRFGVLQKREMRDKGDNPHVLVMTATPIPRTLTLSVYGDLSVSVLNEIPPGRQAVETRAVRESQLGEVLRFVRQGILEKRQAYWVCPLIEENEELDLTAAEARFESLKKSLGVRLALLHGRLSIKEKEGVMRAFEMGETDLLVATSIVEVGVDVPNASIMVIEGAVRFGLSQLHQLRGRIGRGSDKSWCLLIATPKTPEARERIKAMVTIKDGFEIAEFDLKLRGPGELCGVRQHGVTDFRVADLIRDRQLLEVAKEEAERLMARDPLLVTEPELREAVLTRLGETLNLVETA
jgi:ATP-dependent DNA helicase RecG